MKLWNTLALWAIWMMLAGVGCDIREALRAQTAAYREAGAACKAVAP